MVIAVGIIVISEIMQKILLNPDIFQRQMQGKCWKNLSRINKIMLSFEDTVNCLLPSSNKFVLVTVVCKGGFICGEEK